MPIYCRKCRKEVPDLLSTETSTQCPNCGEPISLRDGVPRKTARLLLKDGDETVGEFKITNSLSIGKDKSNDVQILHPTVDLKHAEITAKGGGFVVKDLGSKAGTFVNGQKVTEVTLKDGDEIRSGEIRFLFISPPEPLLPGQDFAISYTRTAQDLAKVRAALPTEQLSSAEPSLTTRRKEASEVARLARALDVGRELASSTDIAVLLERIMDALFENVNPSRAAILLKHPSSGELYTSAVRTRKGGKEKAKIPISRTVVNAAMNKREAILIADSGTLKMGDENTMVRHGIRSALCAPFLLKDQLLGCLYIDCLDATKMLDESDLRFVAAIAGMASVAMVNARLMARLTQERELRQQLEQRAGDAWNQGLPGLEGRDVTVLAMRLMGTWALLESSPPDKVSTLLQELLGILQDRIQVYEGTIIGVTGATTLAIWGHGQARQSDALAAVKAALDVKAMFAQLNASRSARGLKPIWMSLGVATGRSLAGRATFRGRSESTLLGGAVDAAVLLASRAQANQVLLLAAIHQKLAGRLDVTAAEPLAVDGDKPMAVYVLQGFTGASRTAG